MVRAKVENLTNNQDGWALLIITLNDEERSQIHIDPNEDIYDLAVKMINSEEFLHLNEKGFLWSNGEFYFKVRRSLKQKGNLSLKISSKLTDNFTQNQFFFLVKGKGFGPLSLPVMVTMLTRRKDPDFNRQLLAKGGFNASVVGIDDECDPEIEREAPLYGVLTNHPDESKDPGWGLLTISSPQPLKFRFQDNNVKLALIDQSNMTPFPSVDANISKYSEKELSLEIPPDVTKELTLSKDLFNLDLLPTPLSNFPVDTSGFVELPPPKIEEPPLPAPMASIMDLPGHDIGWALLTVNAGNEAYKLNNLESNYQIAVKDPANGNYLVFTGSGFDWSPERAFVNTGFLSLSEGVLSLKVIPGLVSKMDISPLIFSVHFADGEISEMVVDTTALTRPIVQSPPPPPPIPEEAAQPVLQKKKKTGLLIGIIAGILVVLAVLGFLFHRFILNKDGDMLAENEKQEESLESPTPPKPEPEPVLNSPVQEVVPPDKDSKRTVPVKPKDQTAVDTAERLINQGGSQAQMEKAYEEFKLNNDPDSLDASYRLVQTLSKYSPKYKAILGEYFDPLSNDKVPSYITKNAMTAYQYYDDAEKQGYGDAKERRMALLDWSKSPEASGKAGVSELMTIEH
ncbi:MAG: hypothetical protein LBF22_10050 [Deltaproteobacteria bacterium]|jgi:hypothetical protein|nr:hypothetical protein [Deltaproteobacteria bacterium]